MRYLWGGFGGVGVVIGLRWIMLVESNRQVECVLAIFLERLIVIDSVREIVRIILQLGSNGCRSHRDRCRWFQKYAVYVEDY